MLTSGEPLARDSLGVGDELAGSAPPTGGRSGTCASCCRPTWSPGARAPARALPDRIADHDVASVEVTRVDGSRATVGDVLADTFTDAYAVLQDGVLVAEDYQPTGGRAETHAVCR